MKPAASKTPSHLKSYLTAFFMLLLLAGSAVKTEATLPDLINGIPEMGKLLAEMVPPDWSYFPVITKPILQTIQMAVLGTTYGAILAIPLSILAARNLTTAPWLYHPARAILNLIRTIPELLYAALFVAVFGLGPVPGVMALLFFSLGLIAKLTYESIESIDPGPLEAMTAVGATKLQKIQYGVVPQVTAQFIAYFLYTFEVNIRAAAVLGLVGAGGIGLFLDRTLGLLHYRQTSAIIIFILVIILIIDYTSTKLREKLL